MAPRESRPGDKLPLPAALINDLTRQANRINALGGDGELLVRHEPGGPQVEKVLREEGFAEPAVAAVVFNDGDDPIPPFGICEITGSWQTTDDELITKRVLKIQKPTAAATRICVTRQAIAKDGGGLAFVAGVFLVTMRKWFANIERLDRLSIEPDECYGLADVNGPLELLYSDPEAAIDTDHLAVARMTYGRPLRWANTAATSIDRGEPIILDIGDSNGLADAGETKGLLAGKSPDTDTDKLSYACLGGPVANAAAGAAAHGLAICKVDQTVEPGDNIGPVDSETTFMKDDLGWVVESLLGGHGGSTYALARPFRPCRVFVDLVNQIRSDDAGTPYPNTGDLLRDIDGGITRDVLLHFMSPLTALHAVRVLQSVLCKLTWNVDGDAGETFSDAGLDIIAKLQLTDWDDTVTWTDAAGHVERETSIVESHVTADANPVSAGESPNFTLDAPDAGMGYLYWDYDRGGYELTDADRNAGRRIYGVRLTLSPDVYDGTSKIAQGTIDTTVAAGSEVNWAIML